MRVCAEQGVSEDCWQEPVGARPPGVTKRAAVACGSTAALPSAPPPQPVLVHRRWRLEGEIVARPPFLSAPSLSV